MIPDTTLTQEITSAIVPAFTRDNIKVSNDHRIALLMVAQANLTLACEAVSASLCRFDQLSMADIVFISSQTLNQQPEQAVSEGLRLHLISSDELQEVQGCLCCSMRSEMASVLSRLFLQVLRREQPSVRLVVIVTAGGYAQPLKQTLRHAPFLGQRYRFLGAVQALD
jgi:hypothetical protein